MALNDIDMLSQTARGTQYPGIANPTVANDFMGTNPNETNFVNDPTSDVLGAGADPERFQGHKDAKRLMKQQAGVVEARPGIIESTNIDPLNENSNKDDGWANANAGTTSHGTKPSRGVASTATGAAKIVYGTVIGDERTKQAGRDAMH